ncbi:MAG: DUF523 domain-containing protein [Eubacteriales bacterium]|nr:DUF523 domain-containing protein [Eubacterium sp.]MDD7572990.1 DUF523 domain-containing protein [Eubacteriales bacterium]
MNKPYLLISMCLLGEPCRYDGKSVPLDGTIIEKLKEKYTLVTVCPEQEGGLPTPRIPAERQGENVVRRDGVDVTAEYRKGAEVALSLCRRFGISIALMKAKSPSCGAGRIYDGTFSGTLTDGDGVTVSLLSGNGIKIFTENDINSLL